MPEWQEERAKLVEGHRALAKRLAAEVEARQVVHSKLVAAESAAAMLDAAERAAADAGARAEAHQQRIDSLLGSLESRDKEVRELQVRT